jgi:Ser/Thr protein kinase RdoA (MazF antagonist)
MMPLAALDALRDLVAEDWTCPVADEVAAAWGVAPGQAQWWRSSASHVFVTPLGYLRFVPPSVRPFDAVERTAALMAALAASVPVVRPVPALSGAPVSLVTTRLGPMCAMLVQRAPGEPLDIEELTVAGATAWGRSLASLHEAAALHDAAFPWPTEQTYGLPPDDSRFGLIHGDFELDNLAWLDGVPTAYDFDEATRSWYAADVAYALRDAEDRPDLVAAFVAGYQDVRPLDVASLPRFRRLNAARRAASLEALLAADTAPEAHPELAAKLRQALDRESAIASGRA